MSKQHKIDKDNISYRLIDDEAVILNLDSGYYYNLNKSGTEILKLIKKGKTTAEIIEIFKAEYNAPEKTIERDVKGIISDLKKEKIIEAVD